MAALPVESSWRMVEGEHDSFDTSVVPNVLANEDGPGQRDNSDDQTIVPRSMDLDGTPGGSAHIDKDSKDSKDNDAASSSSPPRLAPGDSFASASSLSNGSLHSSDIHAFLRKAAHDAAGDGASALLRSPFQPSLPSSVRESPMAGGGRLKSPIRLDGGLKSPIRLDGGSLKSPIQFDGGGDGAYGADRGSPNGFPSPSPVLRMPVLDGDGGAPQARSSSGGSRFGASETGSPMPRRRQRSGGSLEDNKMGDADRSANPAPTTKTKTKTTKTKASPPPPPPTAWGPLLLFLLVGTTVFAACCCRFGVCPAGTAALCRLPGLSLLSAASAPAPAPAPAPEDDQKSQPPTLADDADALMHWQTQLVDIVRARVPTRDDAAANGDSRGDTRLPRAHDAWLVPRVRTKPLRALCHHHHHHGDDNAPLLRRALDHYLDDTRAVSAALARLQAGAAAVAAGPLAHRTHQTLAQLRRMAATMEPGLVVLVAEAPLRDAYRRHAEAVLAKTAARVHEAEAVAAALAVAGQRLERVAELVAARRDDDGEEEKQEEEGEEAIKEDVYPSLLHLLWHWLTDSWSPSGAGAGADNAGAALAEGLAALQTLQAEHAEAVDRAADTVGELGAVGAALAQLEERFGGEWGGVNRRANVRLHRDIVEEGIRALDVRR